MVFSGVAYTQPVPQQKKPVVTWVKVPKEKALTELVKEADTGKLLSAQTFTVEQLQLALGQMDVKYTEDKKTLLGLISQANEEVTKK